jgi:hypothetical protein
VDGISKEGCTNANGELTESIPWMPRENSVARGEDREEMTIHFGFLPTGNFTNETRQALAQAHGS